MCFDEVGVIIAREKRPCQWCLVPKPPGKPLEKFVYFTPKRRRPGRGVAPGRSCPSPSPAPAEGKRENKNHAAWRGGSLLVLPWGLTARWRCAHSHRRSDRPDQCRGSCRSCVRSLLSISFIVCLKYSTGCTKIKLSFCELYRKVRGVFGQRWSRAYAARSHRPLETTKEGAEAPSLDAPPGGE